MFALGVGVAFRRRDISTSLIRAVEEEANRLGLQSAHLEVAMDNATAFRLYKRLGYTQQGGPITDRWSKVAADGSRQEAEEVSRVIIKTLETPEE